MFYFRMGFCKTLKEFHSTNSIAKFSEICSQFPQAFFTTSLQSTKYKLAQTNFKKNILPYLKKRYMKIHCLSQKWHCLGSIHSNSRKEKTGPSQTPASFMDQDYVPVPDVLRSYPPICYQIWVFSFIKVQAAAVTKEIQKLPKIMFTIFQFTPIFITIDLQFYYYFYSITLISHHTFIQC